MTTFDREERAYPLLPPYVLGSRREVWNYLTTLQPWEDGWIAFRVKDLPDAIRLRCGHLYRVATISDALASLARDGYIAYRPGTKARASMARIIGATAA